MNPISLSRRCLAPSCNNEHSALEESIEECGKVIWFVTAKTFFKIAHCYILASRYLMCRCINNEKCSYCKRIRSGVYAACYFNYKNCNQEEVLSKLKIEFNTNECSFFAEIFETEKIENREQREQYMSDYVFSSS